MADDYADLGFVPDDDLGFVPDPAPQKPGKIKSGIDFLMSRAGIVLEPIAQGGRAISRGVGDYTGDFVSKQQEFRAQKMRGKDPGHNPIAIGAGALAQTATDLIAPQDQFGAAMLAAGPAAKGLGKAGSWAVGKATPLAQEGAEWLYKVGPNIYPRAAKYILQNFDDVMKAPSVKEATETYSKATGGLKHWAESMKDRFGTMRPSEYVKQHTDNVILELETLPAGQKPNLSPQDALDAIQSINIQERSVLSEIKNKTLRKQKVDEFGAIKDKLYSVLESGGLKVREAAKNLRNAYAREEATSLFPSNKAGDKNVLRGLGAVGDAQLAAGLAYMGHPVAAAGAASMIPLVSPKAVSAGFRNVKKAGDIAGSPNTYRGLALFADEPTKQLNKKRPNDR